MSRITAIALLIFAASTLAAAQKPKATPASFPGLGPVHVEILNAAKKTMAIPLPTWLPPGFKVENVDVHLGSDVPIEDKRLLIVYSRKLPDGKVQRFSIEAGFDGLGGLPYDLTKTLRTPVGPIDLMYQPPDPDYEGKKLVNFAMTEWFKVGKTDFHYNGMHGANEDDEDPGIAMISRADTEKILMSLRRY